MAKIFRAATRIKYGSPADASGESKVTIFEVGQEVRGLTKDEMASLWDAGALTADDAPAPEPKPAIEVEEPVEA